MAHHARLSHPWRRLATVATATLLALAGPVATTTSASAQSTPVPDFDTTPTCVIDIIAISCFAEGSATGGGEIVSWVWEYPGIFSNVAEGQNPLLRFENTGTFEVTLTVTDDQDQTGSVTKKMVVEINA
jgi:PKD repeat protein